MNSDLLFSMSRDEYVDGCTFLSEIAALHAAELAADEVAVQRILHELKLSNDAPDAWHNPFAACAFCESHLLAKCPAAFWRRLGKRFPNIRHALGSVCAALCDEDILDLDELKEALCVQLGRGISISLQEGSYATGGIGRHLYAAATALSTVLVEHSTPCIPSLQGLQVLELGCGLGLVGLTTARLGAASVIMTDHAEASVQCAAANAALNGFSEHDGVRSALLDWNDFATPDGGRAACLRAGIGVGNAEEQWWPNVIVAADVCYGDAMGHAIIQTLGYLLAVSPATTLAVIVNGWPNRGLSRLETVVGVRESLAIQEEQALAAGEPPPPRRPFIDENCDSSQPAAGATGPDVQSWDAPHGLENLEVAAEPVRLTGFSDHAHHLYVFRARQHVT